MTLSTVLEFFLKDNFYEEDLMQIPNSKIHLTEFEKQFHRKIILEPRIGNYNNNKNSHYPIKINILIISANEKFFLLYLKFFSQQKF